MTAATGDHAPAGTATLPAGVRLSSLADAKVMPWANGRGVTRELLRRETPDGRLFCRLSVADVVEPGAFSPLPGIDRHLTLIEGQGFTLSVNGYVVPVAFGEPLAFSGDDDVAATTVDGPSRDFNVMVDRAVARAVVSRRDGNFEDVSPAALRCYFVVQGAFAASLLPDRPLAAGDLLELDRDGPCPVTFAGSGVLVAVHVNPV